MGNETERRATAAEKRAEALALRRSGMSYDEIAQEVGYANKGGAYKAVQTALKDITREPAQELLELELDRLDDLQAGVYTAARNGGTFEIDRVLKIMDMRAKYLGIHEQKRDDAGTAEVIAALAAFGTAVQAAIPRDGDS